MSPTVVLASSPSPLATAPTLHLLPFSLGPHSRPFSSLSEDISAFFQPRPASLPGTSKSSNSGTGSAADHPSSGSSGALLTAAFRGRQVFGQEVRVPRGYKGLVIAADKWGVETYSQADGGDRDRRTALSGRWPLTPAASTVSSMAADSIESGGIQHGTADERARGQDNEDENGDEDDLRLRRHPRTKRSFGQLRQRVKGAGQVALARPKRVMAKVGIKRFKLDLDSDDEEEEDIQGQVAAGAGAGVGSGEGPDKLAEFDGPSGSVRAAIPIVSVASSAKAGDTPETETLDLSTPRKRARPNPVTPSPSRQSPRLHPQRPHTPATSLLSPSVRRVHALPEIKLQEATPLKEPLPPPPPFMRRRRNKADYVIPGQEGVADAGDIDGPDGSEMLEEGVGVGGVVDLEHGQDEAYGGMVSEPDVGVEEVQDETGSEEEKVIIPSPATEDDPPTFPIGPISAHGTALKQLPPPSSATDTVNGMSPHDIVRDLDIAGPIRVIRPVSTFESITLWTPDAPLAGYAPIPNANAAIPHVKVSDGQVIDTAASAEPDVPADDGGINVRPGWWPAGGGGEGGDEVVRAMGEWLGLVEMLNEPVYLDKFKADVEAFEQDEDDD